jgi:RimJ/RimL family protein N-acetyltransferase
MAELRLIWIDTAMAGALHQGGPHFESIYNVRLENSAQILRDVIGQTLAMHKTKPPAPWGGYVGADSQTGFVIGTCAFTNQPDANGIVEIAYFTFPEYERRGYATAMAKALIKIALSSPLVKEVIANTLAEPNASTRVLEKVGMTWRGEVIDPVDGKIWRWGLVAPVSTQR